MDKDCSLQLLTSVRHLVLNLTQQHDESREFVQFFHKQLGGILQVRTRHKDVLAAGHSKPVKLNPETPSPLQDSLGKFEGRTLKDCGEDLLVEISEILFNELAFFRLMQDLDSSSNVAKHKSKKMEENPSKTRQGVKVRLGFHQHTNEAENKTFNPSFLCEGECGSWGEVRFSSVRG